MNWNDNDLMGRTLLILDKKANMVKMSLFREEEKRMKKYYRLIIPTMIIAVVLTMILVFFGDSWADPPAAPSGLTTIAVSSSEIHLNWINNSIYAHGFMIERDGSQIATVGANETNYQDKCLDHNTPYSYRVRAYNYDGVSGYSNKAFATTPIITTVCSSGCNQYSIQAAIDVSCDGDVIIVGNGTYYENIDFDGKAITIRSENGSDTTIIDGNQSGSVVTFNSGEGAGSVLNGFTLTNGSGDANGGGIYCYSSSPIIKNCNINGNSADLGGGIFCHYFSSPIITNCTITSNLANFHGGGIYCIANSSPTITNCTISSNSAGDSPARCGGGIYCAASSSPTITNCTINDNSANTGGGIYCANSSSITITNCTVSDNSAKTFGGGIYCLDSSPTITNCTISSNSAGDYGGGIYCIASSSPTVVNSILWGDTVAGSPNEIFLLMDSITITYSNINPSYITGLGTPSLSNNINADPQFDSNYHLTASSPCIDTGTSSGAPSDDIDGDPRPQGTGYDMGSDEYQSGGGNGCQQISIDLNSGWNLISLCMDPAYTAIASVLDSISGKYLSGWAFMDGGWRVYDPQNPGFSDLTTLEAGWGYWINMNEPATLTVCGSAPSSSIDLVSGWNLVGYNSCAPQPIDDALTSINGKYVSVWAYINGAWKVYDPANSGFSDLTTMSPNYGYWIKTTEACTWTMP